jgi:hypothetical protein
MRSERGQATVEWTGLVLLVGLALAALVAFGPRIDGRSYGGWLTHALLCAVRGGCDDGDRSLQVVYGAGDAALLRRYAPNIVYEPGTYSLPVDYRTCRSHLCSDAPDDRSLDVHESKRGGLPATVFTHVARAGGATYLQYWFYYPDSTTTVANAAGAWNTVQNFVAQSSAGTKSTYPGFHSDDWESYQVRVGADGQASVRASAHHGYQGCKQIRCRNEWTPWTGWTRVSRGSHAGHIPLEDHGGGFAFQDDHIVLVPHDDRPVYPGLDVQERTTTAAGLNLVPIEPLARWGGEEWDGITPPWEKEVYRDPSSDSTG